MDQLRRKLFHADVDWIAAEEVLSKAQKELQAEKEYYKSAVASSSRNRQELQNAQSVAASARAVIADGESRLRLLSKVPSGRSQSTRNHR